MPEEIIPLTEEEINRLVKAAGLDPMLEVIKFAKGDVVGLGLMTQEEFDAEEEYNTDGFKIAKSGREIATELVPPRMRMAASLELMEYIYPKMNKRAIVQEDTKTIGDAGTTMFLPHNNRDDIYTDLPTEKDVEAKIVNESEE